MAGLFGDVMGYIDTGRAAKSISDANIASEHGVLDATKNGQQWIGDQGNANTAAAGASNDNLETKNTANQSIYAPGIASGAQGNTSLQAYAASNPQFHAPTAEEVQNTPGYKFQLQAGSDAITNNLAAMGIQDSGKSLTDLTKFGQGLAGTYYQNAFSNAQSQFQTNQKATLDNLSTLIDSGKAADAGAATSNLTTGQGQSQNSNVAGALNTDLTKYGAGLGLQGATTAGDFAVGAGTAHAAGITGQGAALNQGVTDLAGLITNPAMGIVPAG